MFKNIKKSVSLLLILLLVLSLVACGNNDEEGAVKEGKNVEAKEVYHGIALANLTRDDMGVDDNENPIYGINQVIVNALFNENDQIIDIMIDQLELNSPNAGENIQTFNGFPNQGGYANIEVNEDSFQEEISNWKTKREFGEDYMLDSGSWKEQISVFEEEMIGKTPREVIEWYTTYFSDINGKPVKKDSESIVDQEKYEKLSDEEKEMMDDITSTATMSLNGPSGNIILAVKNAAKNKKKIDMNSLSDMGIGLSTSSTKMEDEYALNEVYANTILDEDGKIISIFIDQLEIFSDNEDGNASVFLGYPGQTRNEEEVGIGDFADSVHNWKTKRDFGEDYMLDSGSWAEQMDKIQEELVGKNAEEVKSWAKEYSEKEKLVSGATISIEGSTGEIVEAILKSFENTKNN